MGQLADRARELSPFLILADGETVTAKYIGWKEIASTFDPKLSLFQYELEVNNVQKFWKSGNKKHAIFFDGLKKGELVIITRHGMERETKYELERTKDESGELTQKDIDQLEVELSG